METQEIVEKIVGFLRGPKGHEVGLLVTADSKGRPHGTYLGTVASPSIDHLLAMTGPDSRKVVNILENPQVEWLFSDTVKEELLYVRGKARVIQDPREVEEDWRMIPDKSRAYFLSYQDVGMKFLIFETRIESFEYRLPRENTSYFVTISEVEGLLR